MNRFIAFLITLCMSSAALAEPPWAPLEARIAELEALLAGVTRGIDPNTGSDTLQFSGMNVQVVNGAGATDAINGTGNLIVGYNEIRDWEGGVNYRTGSHMIVVGYQHNYSNAGGLLVGRHNDVTGPFASVSGGAGNLASGLSSSVSGGDYNVAQGENSSVSGGLGNFANAYGASVSGGQSNEATADAASVSGGYVNFANGRWTSIVGGGNNASSGEMSSVTGGQYNHAQSNWSSVTGGAANQTFGEHSSISGGDARVVDGQFDWRAGSLWEDN